MTDEALGTLWAKALAGTFEHLRKFLAVYVVFTGIAGGLGTMTWKMFFKPALAAEMKEELKDQLNAPCLRDEFGERENTLACSIEESAENDAALTEAVQSLTERADTLEQAIAADQLKRSQETEQILQALEHLKVE